VSEKLPPPDRSISMGSYDMCCTKRLDPGPEIKATAASGEVAKAHEELDSPLVALRLLRSDQGFDLAPQLWRLRCKPAFLERREGRAVAVPPGEKNKGPTGQEERSAHGEAAEVSRVKRT
jgi:hypothetical protein